MAAEPTALRSFDPTRHLSLINGNEYLEVKRRIVWLRTEHLEAEIDTNLETYTGTEAVFKATVRIPGLGSATGWGSEDAQSFGDFIEKAETKAIGRALGALGYGTQFTRDFEFGSDQGRVVDSPVQRSDAPRQFQSNGGNRPQASSGQMATEKQVSLISSLGRDLKMDQNALNALAEENTGRALDALSRRDASALIDVLQGRRMERGNA